MKCHTSDSVATDSAHQTINPSRVLLCLPHDRRVTLLQNLVDRDQGLERLDFVGEDGLPAIR